MDETGKTAESEEGEPVLQAYEAMAPVYDAFTASYDPERWTGGILAAAEEQGLNGRRLLDVACGTGNSFLPMIERGWEVTGCDISPSMLEIAREKAGDAVRLVVADGVKVGEVPTHRHRQRHFPFEEVLGALEGVGLECLDVIGQDWDVFVRPLDELVHNKAVYVARKVERR